jgi:hypothetical protein
MRYNKEIVLSIGPYRTMRIAVIEAESFAACDKELMKEINKHKEIKDMNAEEIQKVLGE